MTQDQYGQARDSGYVGGQVVDDDETGEFSDDEAKPMTRFQKVASALRGDRPDQDPTDSPDSPDSPDAGDQADAYQAGAGQTGTGPVGTYSPDATGADPDRATVPDPYGTAPDTTAAAGPGAQRDDYWDTQDARGTGQAPVVAVTSPDVPVTDSDADPLAGQAGTASQDTASARDPLRTQPDIFDAGAPTGNAVDATMPDVPVTGASNGAGVTGAPDGAAVTEAPGAAGRHAAAADLRPGEATGTLDNLGDLAYGKLIPDAADFTAQWQQIQFKFVDDPRASVTEAADVVAQVTAKLEAAIQERQRAIEEQQRAIQEQQRSLRGRWGEGAQADTETLRETLRMYKAFLDQLIGPKV